MVPIYRVTARTNCVIYLNTRTISGTYKNSKLLGIIPSIVFISGCICRPVIIIHVKKANMLTVHPGNDVT